MLQVTLNTSLKLHGRATELPWSDFNRQVIRFTRHTLQMRNSRIESLVMIATRNLQRCTMNVQVWRVLDKKYYLMGAPHNFSAHPKGDFRRQVLRRHDSAPPY